MEEVFTVEQVAEKLALKPNTVRKWLRDGWIVGVRLGKEWRILESDLMACLRGHRVLPDQEAPEARTDNAAEVSSQ